MITYRRYQQQDIPKGIELAKFLLKDMPNYTNVILDENKLEAILKSNVNNVKFYLNFAFDDSELVGVCCATLMEPIFNRDLLAVDQFIYVKPDRRSNGIATELITGLVVWAKERGVNRIRLASTTGWDLDTYNKIRESHGFKHVGNIYEKEL